MTKVSKSTLSVKFDEASPPLQRPIYASTVTLTDFSDESPIEEIDIIYSNGSGMLNGCRVYLFGKAGQRDQFHDLARALDNCLEGSNLASSEPRYPDNPDASQRGNVRFESISKVRMPEYIDQFLKELHLQMPLFEGDQEQQGVKLLQLIDKVKTAITKDAERGQQAISALIEKQPKLGQP